MGTTLKGLFTEGRVPGNHTGEGWFNCFRRSNPYRSLRPQGLFCIGREREKRVETPTAPVSTTGSSLGVRRKRSLVELSGDRTPTSESSRLGPNRIVPLDVPVRPPPAVEKSNLNSKTHCPLSPRLLFLGLRLRGARLRNGHGRAFLFRRNTQERGSARRYLVVPHQVVVLQVREGGTN